MNGLDLAVAQSTLVGFFLALARTGGFVLTAPPFNARGIPARARTGVAIALALPLAALIRDGDTSLTETSELIQAVVLQVVTGVTLGAFVQIAVAAIQMLGDLIDVVGGFTLSVGMDPLLLTQTSVMGRLHQLLAMTLLFFGDGHLLVIQGLSRSVQLMPDPRLDLTAIGRVLTADLAQIFLSAVQIAAPIIGALLIADVALGLLTRAAPALQAFSLALPLKILLTLLLVGLVLQQLPAFLDDLIEQAVGTMIRFSGG